MNKFEINLNLYRSFYYVAKYEGFTKASTHAMLSQSSLSTNIKILEESLETKLFYRKTNNLTLTKEGKALFSKLEEVVNILNKDIEQKELNIGCLRVIADNYLDDTIQKFKQQFKDITINFNFSKNTELYQMLKKDDIDIIISRYPLFYKFDNYITVEKIKDIENVFVCSKSFFEKEKEKMKERDYVFPLILPDSSEKRRKIEQYLIDNDINYNVDIEIPNSNLVKKLILKDIGIGYINKKYVEEELKNNEMIIVDKFKNIPLDNITIIYDSKKNNYIVDTFVKIFKETI